MFTIDFTKPWLYKDIIYFNQGNLSTNNTLRCKLVTGGSDDFTGGSIACTFTTKDSVEISGFGKLIDAKSGIIDIVFPSNALVVGTNKLEVLVNRADGGVAQSPPVMYDIWQGLTTGNGIEAETNYPILIQLINSTNEASNKANSALNKANSMITDITEATDNAYRSANDADIATSNANTKIEEVETAKTEMIKKVDTSIVTMKSEVDRALAAGTVDLELKQARKDASGVVYDNLKQMLDANLGVEGKTLKDLVIDMNNMKEMQDLEYSTDKGYAVCEKTGNGIVKDLKIYGKSLVNLVPYGKKNNQLINNNYFGSLSLNKDIIIPGKSFTFIYSDVIKNSNTLNDTFGSIVIVYSDNSYTEGIVMKNEYNTLINIQNKTIKSVEIRYGRKQEIHTTTLDYEIMLIEGDYTEIPLGYFEGLANVGNGDEIEALSVKSDGNMIPPKYTIGGVNANTGEDYNQTTQYIRSDYFTLVKGRYYVKELESNPKFLYLYNLSGGYIGKKTISSQKYVDIENTCMARIDMNLLRVATDEDLNSIKVALSTSENPNLVYKQDKKTILFKDTDNTWKPILNLRGIDENNCDIFDTINSKFYQKIKRSTINGSKNWVAIYGSKPNTFVFSCVLPDCKPSESANSFPILLSDKFKIASQNNCYNLDEESISISTTGELRLSILKSKASTVEQLKSYLNNNYFEIEYLLKDTIEYEINPIYPEAFEDETLMLFKTGPISPRANWKITSNLVGVLGNVKDRVKRMENDLYKYTVTQNRMQLGTTYSSDRTTFRVDTATFSTEKAKQDLDYDLFRLLKHNILVGPHNYDKAEMENMMDFYVSVGKIDYNMWDELYMLIEEQHNPPVEEEAPVI